MRKATSQKILTNPLEDLSGRASINLQPTPSSRRSSTRKLGESKTLLSTKTLRDIPGKAKPISIYKSHVFNELEEHEPQTVIHKWDINARWGRICDNTVFKPTDLDLFRKKEEKKKSHVRFEDDTVKRDMPESEHMYYYFEMNRNSRAMEKILNTNIQLPLSGTGERVLRRVRIEDENKNMRVTSFDAFRKRKITLKKQLTKLPMNQKQKRRKSCHCSECGGLSKLEKKLELDKSYNKDPSHSSTFQNNNKGASNSNSPALHKKKRVIQKGAKHNQKKRLLVSQTLKDGSQPSSSVRFPSNSETDNISSSCRNDLLTPEESLKRGIAKKPVEKLLTSHIRAASDERGKFSSMYYAMNSPAGSVNMSNPQLEEEGSNRGIERSKTLGKLHSEDNSSPTAISPLTNNSSSPHSDYKTNSPFAKRAEEASAQENHLGPNKNGMLRLKLVSKSNTMPNNDFVVEKQSSIVEFSSVNKNELSVVQELASPAKKEGNNKGVFLVKQSNRRNTRSQKSLIDRPMINQQTPPQGSVSILMRSAHKGLKMRSELKRIVRDKPLSTSSKIISVYRPNTTMKLSSILEMSKSKIEQHSVLTPVTNFAKSATLKEAPLKDSPYYFSHKMPGISRSHTSSINLLVAVAQGGNNDKDSRFPNKLSTVRSEYIDESKEVMMAVNRMTTSLLKPLNKYKERSQNSSMFASSGGGSGISVSTQKTGVTYPNKVLLDVIARKIRNKDMM